MTQGLHGGVEEGSTPVAGLLHFTLDPYLSNDKEGSIKYHFWVFVSLRPGIEPRSPGPLVDTLLIRPRIIIL